MTTSVKVSANHGWPVDVTQVSIRGGSPLYPTRRVQPGCEETFSVHSGADLLVHEVQPHEIVAENPTEITAGEA